MKKYYKTIILIIFLFFVFYSYLCLYVPRDNSENPRYQEFIIKEGDSLRSIASNLQKNGIIRNHLFFIFHVVQKDKARKMMAGGYLLSPSMTMKKIASIISTGKVFINKINILEGWNNNDIAHYLEEKEIMTKDDFLFALENFSDYKSFSFLKDLEEKNSIEGFLFPDTYNIQSNTTAEDIILMMLKNFERKVFNSLIIDSQEKSLFEIITVASLIEKEAQSKEDKKIVSDIIWKRLDSNIPLELCSTIVYITKKREIRADELKIDSPYNTYLYSGLPKGPIANPGRESIDAALNPEETPYWYFLSTSSGETLFSATLEEHNVKKAKYLR